MLHTDTIAAALVRLLRPLVKTLLRLGLPYRACADALRWTYVDVATREFAVDQRQSKSRIAVITGLSRVEVERLQREPPIDPERKKSVLTRAGRVLDAWRSEARCLNQAGAPKALPLESSDANEVSFAWLVQRYSGGATLRSVLDELQAKAAVRLDEQQQLHYVSANLKVGRDLEQQLELVSTSAADLLHTIERNLTRNTDHFLQAYVEHLHVPIELIPAVRALVRSKSAEFMDAFDALIASAPSTSEAKNSATHCERLGMGFYYFQDEPPAPPAPLDRRGRKSRASDTADISKSMAKPAQSATSSKTS
jgi:hypothetical protein